MAFYPDKYLEVVNQISVGTPMAGMIRLYGKTDKLLYMKDEDGVETSLTGESFLSLSDTPNSYTGMSASGVRVNTGESGLEFFDVASLIANSRRTQSLIDSVDSILGNNDSGVISTVIIDGGTGYISPTVTIDPPAAGGTTATATATVVGGVITAITITDPGSGYTVDYDSDDPNPHPTVTITDAGGSGADVICYVSSPFPIGMCGHYLAMACVLRNNKVVVWGYNEAAYGKLALGGTAYATRPTYPPFELQTTDVDSPDIVAIARGGYNTFLLSSEGEVWAVGANSAGQLANGTTTDFGKYFRKIDPSYFGNSPVVKIKTSAGSSVGSTVVFVLTADGKCYRWGYNTQYELGNGSTSNGTTPTELLLPVHNAMTSNSTPGSQVVSASSEDSAAYAAWYAFDRTVTTSGYGWVSTTADIVGSWLKIDLGAGNSTIVTKYDMWATYSSMNRTPKDWKIQGSTNDAAWTTLSTVTNQTAWASRELRRFTFTNTTAYRYYRIYIDAVDGAVDKASIGEIAFYETEATRSKVVDFSFTGGHVYAGTLLLTDRDEVWVCGYNNYGCLSLGHMVDVPMPVRMQTASGANYVTGVKKILGTGSTYYPISMILLSSGTILMAGYNGSGYLCNGNNNSTNNGYVNTVLDAAVNPLSGVSDIWVAPGADTGSTVHMFAKSGSTYYCWGQNTYGELGLGTTINTYVYAQENTGIATILSGATVKKIFLHKWSDYGFSLIVLSDGRVYGTGYNGHYQIATGDDTNQSTWTRTLGAPANIVDLGLSNLGVYGPCNLVAVGSDGRLWVAGLANWFQLGDGQYSYDSRTLKYFRF